MAKDKRVARIAATEARTKERIERQKEREDKEHKKKIKNNNNNWQGKRWMQERFKKCWKEEEG